MAIKIDKKIVGYHIHDEPPAPNDRNNVIQMHETLERPERLIGSTYKLKSPAVSEHAMYITINDIVLNEGTEHEMRRPFEVFINSKNLDHFQWIVALTRIMSAVFRKGGDVTFLVEELRSVFDPRGGYWNKGKYMPSIIAEIGDVIERHLIDIGMLQPAGLDPHQQQLLDDKKAQLTLHSQSSESLAEQTAAQAPELPDNATLCAKCNVRAAVMMDGCITCLNCGDSKCG